MPRSSLVPAAIAAAVALPCATVVLAAPSFAGDAGRGYARGLLVPVPAAGGSGSYGGSYGGYGGGFGTPYAQGQPGQQSSTTSLAGLDTTAATDAQETGLVRIATVIDYGQGKAAGTGIVLTSDGVVVTNHHVVEGATRIRVTVLSTGQTYTADVLGSSTRKDVAVLQLRNASGLTTATTDAAKVAVGQAVTAVGDAAGKAATLTAAPGTVSALRRSITVSDEETGAKHRLHRLIKVSSDVIPGDSGGALRAADGDVVGMTVAASSGHTSATVDGYVIPWNRVARVEQAVLAGQTTGDIVLGSSAFLGVTLDQQTDTTTIAGVVRRSPAAAAGLTAGDTVSGVDGTAVSTGTALRRAIAAHAAGDTVTVTWTDTAGLGHSATVTLAQGPVA